MKRLHMVFRKKISLVWLLPVFLFACSKIPEIGEANLPRLFTPVGITLTLAETQVKIEWSPSLFSQDKAVQYIVEISKDSTFQAAADFTTSVDTTVVVVTDADIAVRQRYFARVKADATGASIGSGWFTSEGFSMTGEQIFVVPVPESDIIDRAVILRWTTTPGVTKIVITPPAGPSVDIPLSAADNTAGMKLIENLQSNTVYFAEIFAGAISKGFLSFTTKETITGSSVIDLRGIANRPSVLEDTISVVPSGSIIILKRGLTYTLSSTNYVDRSFTILSGADFISDLATIYFTSNFNLLDGSNIDSITFKDLNLESDNYGSRYVFNINTTGTIGKVNFENIRGHRFRGWFRCQNGGAGTQVNEVNIMNCVIDSLREYALVTTNNSNAVANIYVANSTVYSARRVIDHRSAGSNSITFENCTFYRLPGGNTSGSNYFIDLSSNNSANPITLTNCIFGQSWDELGQGNDVPGIRTGSSTTVSVSNSYQAADFVSTNMSYQIPGLVPYTGSSYDLFTDPDNGDFSIKDGGFAGRGNSGDPRWY